MPELNGVDNYNNNNLIFQQQNESQHQQQQQIQTPTRPSSSSNYCKKEECSGDELPPNEELIGAPVHEIRCGLLIGKLHMIRFTCPGIHRKCVEFEGKLISPRQFTIKAEKDKQKDWKGSIRLGKHNLRTLMEMKTLDFYEHEINCSLKCQSRNYIKNRKAEGGNNEMNINSDNNSERFSEMCEINDIKSIPSSACSSATSTRKSSSVLEEFACQTVPPIYSDHPHHHQNNNNHQNFAYLNEIEEEEEMLTSQNNSKTFYSSPSSSTPSTTTNTFLPSTSSIPLNSPNLPSDLINFKKGGESTSLLNNNTLNTLLQLQQHQNNNNSPLKQLLLLPKNLSQNNGIALNR
uniref:SAND domain-containing protein n=1 Tax=Meloidogyne incognita TaxID=6306 RepID=A0A914N9Q3_MELIC